jgi:hypothetical protein
VTRLRVIWVPLSTAASHLEKAFSGCESRVVKMNGAIYGHTVSSVPKQRRRRLVMSFEMVRLDRASSEPLYQQLYRQIREELESGSFDSSASRVPSSSEAITQRALEILRQPSGDTKPDAAAKLLAVAYQIGGGTSNLPGVNRAPVVLQPSALMSRTASSRETGRAIKPLAFTTTTSPGTRSIRRRNASFRNTATLLRMRPRYQMGRTMTKVGFPTTIAEAAIHRTGGRCLHARIHEGRCFSGAGTQAITQPRNSCRGAISCYSLGAENLITCPGFCSELSVAVLPH